MTANSILDEARVVWLDAHGVSGTDAFAIHEIPHAAIEITTRGVILRQDAAGITIAGESCADGTYRALTFVPAGMLVRVEFLEPKRRRRTTATTPPPTPAASASD